MQIVRVNENYINYLRQFDTKVQYNKSETRPYVGIILEVNNHTYFAPLASPKEKHLIMKNSDDFVKIDKGKLGVINLNNMIPIRQNNFTKIDFNNIDLKYKKLLEEQLKWIDRNSDYIKDKASKLYKIIINTKNSNFLTKRCCNLKLLEQKSIEYLQNQTISKELQEKEFLDNALAKLKSDLKSIKPNENAKDSVKEFVNGLKWQGKDKDFER